MNLELSEELKTLEKITARLFDGVEYHGDVQTVYVENGKIARIGPRDGALTFGEHIMLLPGGVSTHNHGRDVYNIFPRENGDQTHKEDAFTLSLALAAGGATFGMGMPNLANDIVTFDQYQEQLVWTNNKLRHRKKPIMTLGQYLLIKEGTEPIKQEGLMYKMLYNTFGPTNLSSDAVHDEVLQPYTLKWVTEHCETIKDILDDPDLPHHLKRQTKAAHNAVRQFLRAADMIGFHPHVAHISTAQEVEMIQIYNQTHEGFNAATCEVTPQSIWLSYDDFAQMTGLDIRWSQQNPPIRSYLQRMQMQRTLPMIDIFATDHAPHTTEEKLGGMSGMPQADTAGVAYLETVSRGLLNLAQFVEKWATNPGKIVERQLGHKVGQLQKKYDASFTIAALNKPSKIVDEDVLTKCGWTPYKNMPWTNTVHGSIISGNLYTRNTLLKMR